MKHLIVVLLCLLLWGCGQETAPAVPEILPDEPALTAVTGLYHPDHPMEQQYPGLIRAYPLAQRNTLGILPLGKDILVLSGEDNTTLTIFTGENLYKKASITLNFSLQPEDPSLQIHENGISFFDDTHQATILLDHQFQEMGRIAAPMGLSGKPVLSSDEKVLYYCTSWSVVAWNLESGIRRTVKEMAYEHQELTGLHLKDQILQCRIRDNGTDVTLLLSADQGLEYRQLPENTLLYTRDDRYFTALTSGYQTLMVFGKTEDAPQLLLPGGNWDQQYYLPEDHGAVTAARCESGIQLHYYELSTGILRSSVTLKAEQMPKSIVNSKDHAVYILFYDPDSGCDILYRWDALRQAPEADNTISFKTDYHNDPQTMKSCQDYADTVGEKYGISIIIGEDAPSLQPWDYQFQPETLAPVLGKELRLLEQRLAQYPETILQQAKAHFTGLTICLVRSITGAADPSSLPAATGIQFFKDNHAYVVITTGKYSEQALYHELYHVMETHILTQSTALDGWEALNPGDFVYNENLQEAEVYLKGQTRAFADRYSMVSSKEDRARILENAIASERKDLFQSEYMQRKLTAVCTGIREAYGLKKHPDPLPWEQYLANPIAPNM